MGRLFRGMLKRAAHIELSQANSVFSSLQLGVLLAQTSSQMRAQALYFAPGRWNKYTETTREKKKEKLRIGEVILQFVDYG